MKICKNNFNIVVYPVTTCATCAFGTNTRQCYWIDIFKEYSFNCGGTITHLTSNIFTL